MFSMRMYQDLSRELNDEIKQKQTNQNKQKLKIQRSKKQQIKEAEETNPYWVWCEFNGWERESWRCYYTNVTAEMQKLIQEIIAKAHQSQENHQTEEYSPHQFCRGFFVCAGCTKFSFEKCRGLAEAIETKINTSNGGYRLFHRKGDILTMEELHTLNAMSNDDIFQYLYKSGQIIKNK